MMKMEIMTIIHCHLKRQGLLIGLVGLIKVVKRRRKNIDMKTMKIANQLTVRNQVRRKSVKTRIKTMVILRDLIRFMVYLVLLGKSKN